MKRAPMRRTDGQFIWVLERGSVVKRDEQGKPQRMVRSFAITERKQLEMALRESEARFGKSPNRCRNSSGLVNPMALVIILADSGSSSPASARLSVRLQLVAANSSC